jgi:hypothetical protein
MANYVHVKVEMPNEDEKQAEAAKTARLRSLRLAKEAADQEQASRDVAPPAPRSRAPRISSPTSQAS